MASLIPRWRTSQLPLRATLAGMNLLHLLVLSWPTTDVIASYPRAYAQWIAVGGYDPAWAVRVGVVAGFGLAALFQWGRATWLVAFVAAFAQGVMFTCLGLLFATTHPPATGIAYFSPAVAAFWLAYRESTR